MSKNILFYFCDFLLLRKVSFHCFASIKFEITSKILFKGYKFVLKSYEILRDTVFFGYN